MTAALERTVGGLERSSTLDSWSGAVRPVAAAALGSGRRLDLLTGRWLGHAVHPMVVIVPLGCWVGAAVLDLSGASWARPAARRLVGVGIVAATPAVATGAADWRDTSGAEQRVGLAHAIVNHVAVVGYVASWFARRKGRDGIGRVIGLAATGAVSAAGYLGGHLAYRRGVGVDTTAFESGPDDWTAIAPLEQLPIDRPTAVVHDDVVLMVLRRAGGVVVLEDRCTHRGGPLHEGPIDGGCITCPWHGSAFDLSTGAIRKGPASTPQPAYDTRVVDGQLEIRREEHGGLRANPVAPSAIRPTA